MPERFLSSEEYDEQAHKLYNDGDYDGALEMLREGLSLYPNAVDLYVGMGYARLAREEFAWARETFERALVLDPGHEDALVGLGETLLRFGDHRRALHLFGQVEAMGYDDDVELMLTMGRALYRERLYSESHEIFARAVSVRPDNAELAAALGYTLHRLGDELGASRQIRRSLRLDPDLHNARIYLGHILYDRGDWEGALREFERVPPGQHWDSLAVWRIIELKRALWQIERGDPRLEPWEERLEELEQLEDPIDQLLSEIEASFGSIAKPDLGQLELFERERTWIADEVHQIRLPDGHAFRGTYHEIVRQMRDQAGFGHETLTEYMRRLAERWHEQFGVEVSFLDTATFVRGAVEAGILHLDD